MTIKKTLKTLRGWSGLTLLFAAMSIHTTTTAPVDAQSQAWKMITVPNFSNISSIAIDSEGIIFAGQRDGYILLSRDSGSSWQQASDSGFAFKGIGGLIVDSTGNLLAGTGAGFFVSTDYGSHWTQRDNGLSFSTYADFYALGSDSAYIFASTSSGLFRSSDKGSKWSQINGTYLSSSIYVSCFLVGRNGYLFAGTTAGVFGSPDYGNTWIRLDSGLPPPYTNVRSLAADSTGDIFAGTDSSIYESTNDGSNWARVFTPKPMAYVNALAVDPNGNLLAGTSNGFYVSTDQGASWNRPFDPVDSSVFVWTFELNKDGNVYAGTGTEGVFMSTDNGNSWKQIDAGPPYSPVNALATDAFGDVIVGTVGGSSISILRSANEGGSWTLGLGLPTIYGDYPTFHALAATGRGNFFAATDANGILHSTDGGKDWVQVSSFKFITVFSIAVDSNGSIYAGTDSGVYVSTDGGSGWSYFGLSGDDDILSLAADPAGNIFAGTGHVGFGPPSGYPRIFRFSRSKGAWTEVYGNRGAGNINSIAVGPGGHVYSVTNLNSSGSSLVLASSDSGVTWMETDSSLASYRTSLVALAVDTAGEVFAGDVNGNGIFLSTDYGHTWTEDTSGLGLNNYVTALTTNSEGDVFAGTNIGGIFEHCIISHVTPVRKSETSLLQGFSLDQNYPNPFNPTTTIVFGLKENSRVTLSIYNVLGEKVEQWDGGMMNAGTYSHIVNMSRFASGVYLYRIEAIGINGDRFMSVRKMLELK